MLLEPEEGAADDAAGMARTLSENRRDGGFGLLLCGLLFDNVVAGVALRLLE